MRHSTVRKLEYNALFLLLCAGLLQPACAAAQSAAERGCRADIAKASSRYASSVYKVIERCHKRRSAGKVALAVDCNDVAQADLKAKLDRRRSKIIDAVSGASASCNAVPELLSLYGRCPSPAADVDDGETTSGIDSFDELSSCLVALIEGTLGQATAQILGNPDKILQKEPRRCQRVLGKGGRKLLSAYSKSRSRCQAARDQAGLGLAYGCSGDDSSGAIAKAESKMAKLLSKKCEFPDPLATSSGNETLDAIGACGDTVGQLVTCVGDVVMAGAGAGLIAAAYELPSDCRAGGLLRRVKAAFGTQLTRTSLSAGSNGLADGVDFTDLFVDAITLDCDADCASCQIKLDPAKNRPEGRCRCASDASKSCDVVNGPDADDCTGLNTQCQCFFGPPLAVSISGNPACVPIEVVSEYAGTVDLGKGDWDTFLQVAAVVHLGLDQFAPCPLCEGDTTPFDGVRDGTCSAGARNNQPCDVNGIHPTYGPSSIDCQPQALTNISGGGLPLSFDLITSSQSLPFQLPCDDATKLCPCRTCSDDNAVGCRDNQECADAGAGLCTGGGGAGIVQNACNDGICSPEGRCEAGPIDSFCDGYVHPSGRGAIQCNSDLDCAALGSDVGSCTIQDKRRCYPDPIEVTGVPSIFTPVASGLACIGVTSSVVINLGAALPGAVRVELEYESTPTCAADPSLPWQPPGGANCVATSSTTTTTLIPPLPCVAGVPPSCGGGDCPAGQVCVSNGVTCACATGTTTTTMPTPCTTATFPLCGQGECPAGSTCQLDLASSSCVCTPGTACQDTFFPICGGDCPLGQSCQGDLLGVACSCGP